MQTHRPPPIRSFLLPVLLWAGIWIGSVGPEESGSTPPDEANGERESIVAPLAGAALPTTASFRPALLPGAKAPPSVPVTLDPVLPEPTRLHQTGRRLDPNLRGSGLPFPVLLDDSSCRTRGPPVRIA